ncbi:hypothetical protein BGW39_010560 [Mortierella sp. 14UC]|nr:hypothetical protein BGW39_010560 [Mortierella sp. 14UC]
MEAREGSLRTGASGHPDILKFQGSFEHEDVLYIVLDLYKTIPQHFIDYQRLVRNILRVLVYSNSKNVFHCDLKQENILASKAQDSVNDLAIKTMFNLAGLSEGRKHDTQSPAPIFAIGLGSFNTRTELSSKHTKIEKQFIQKWDGGGDRLFPSLKKQQQDCRASPSASQQQQHRLY